MANEKPGFMESVQAVLPGLSLDKILGDLAKEAVHQVEFGSHESASLLFRGDAFVMYPKIGQEAEGHGLPVEAMKQIEMETEMER